MRKLSIFLAIFLALAGPVSADYALDQFSTTTLTAGTAVNFGGTQCNVQTFTPTKNNIAKITFGFASTTYRIGITASTSDCFATSTNWLYYKDQIGTSTSNSTSTLILNPPYPLQIGGTYNVKICNLVATSVSNSNIQPRYFTTDTMPGGEQKIQNGSIAGTCNTYAARDWNFQEYYETAYAPEQSTTSSMGTTTSDPNTSYLVYVAIFLLVLFMADVVRRNWAGLTK